MLIVLKKNLLYLVLLLIFSVNAADSIYNPFSITAEKLAPHNSSKIKITVTYTGSGSIDNLQTAGSDNYCDTILIPYATKSFPTDTVNSLGIFRYSVDQIKSTSGVLIDTINVQRLPEVNDSNYYFGIISHWGNSSTSLDSLLMPSIVDTTYIVDSANSLISYTTYYDSIDTDSATIIIKNISFLDSVYDDSITIISSDDSLFNTIVDRQVIPVSKLLSEVVSDSIFYKIKAGEMPIVQKKLFVALAIKTKIAFTSNSVKSSAVVGLPRPQNNFHLTATADNIYLKIDLAWGYDSSATDPTPDSLKIIWSKDSAISVGLIPENYNVLYSQKTKDLTDGSYSIETGLSSDQTYYFGLMVLDSNKIWSLVTLPSSDSTKTVKVDTLNIANLLSLNTAIFDSTKNAIVVDWSIDLTSAPVGVTFEMEYGYSYGLDSTYKTIRPGSPVAVGDPVTSGTFEIALGNNILFDTTINIGLWLISSKFTIVETDTIFAQGISSPITSSSQSLQMPSFTWQNVNLSVSDSTFSVANGMIIIEKDPNYQNNVLNLPVLKSYQLSDTIFNSGFVSVNGVTFSFSDPKSIPDFRVGLKYGTLPTGVSVNQIGFYRIDTNGVCKIKHGFYLKNGIFWATLTQHEIGDIVGGEKIPAIYSLLADTVVPQLTVTATDDSINTTINSLSTTFQLSDNIKNLSWRILYGSGNSGYLYEYTDTISAYSDTVIAMPNMAKINENKILNPSSGARVILQITDGVNTVSKNISLRIKNKSAQKIYFIKDQWTPIIIKNAISDTGFSSVLANSQEFGGKWSYDKKKYRIMKYQNNWLEYSFVNDSLFSLILGRVYWVKSADNYFNINTGLGTTTSLRNPYKIILQPGTWTDFSIPFEFSIKTSDLIFENKYLSTDLDIYHWEFNDSNSIYNAKPIFLADSIMNDTIISTRSYDAYTVYNHSAMPETLSIPPISLAASSFYNDSMGSLKTLQNREKVTTVNKWLLGLNWSVTKGESGALFVGYNSKYKTIRKGGIPPSLGVISASIYDNLDTVGVGYIIKNSNMTDDIYKTKFKNYSTIKQVVSIKLMGVESLPSTITARIIDRNGKGILTEESFELEPGEEIEKIIAVGSENFINQSKSNFAINTFAMFGTFPNPFSSSLNLKYILPVGIKEVKFSIYNSLGRVVYKSLDNKNITSGIHIYSLNRTSSTAFNIASGHYIIKITAVKSDGTKQSLQKSLICIK